MTSCKDIWSQIKPTNTQGDYEDSLLYDIRDTFTDNLYSEIVNKNYDTATDYDVIISEGDKDTKLDGYKKFWSYPYSTVQFGAGDYITWLNKTWLLTSIDNERIYEVYGEIMECTQTLRRYNSDGVLIEKEVPFINIKSGAIISDKDIDTLSGDRIAYIPLDDDVKEWIDAFRNDDEPILFPIIDEMAVYELAHIDTASSSTLAKLKFELYTTQINNVNWSVGVIVPTEIETFTLSIEPTTVEMSISDTVTFTATVKNGFGDIQTKDVTWTSSNTSLATIDIDGILTAIGNGSITVSCEMTDNSSVTDSSPVTITAIVVDNYEIQLIPYLTNLKPEQYQGYTVKLLNNGVETVDTFTISIGGQTDIDNDDYYFEQLTNTTFAIRNKGIDTDTIINVDVVGTLYNDTINIVLENSIW
jgi:plastocyanin